jgi:multidrug efflux pump subunit AcrA (membrane-fusion protein)
VASQLLPLDQPEVPMKILILTLVTLTSSLSQQSQPVVPKDSISIHTVRKGNMRLRLILGGTITSIDPARAIVTGPTNAAAQLKTGQTIDFEIQTKRTSGNFPVGTGRVTRLESDNSMGSIRAEIEFVNSLLEGTAVGTRIGALIDIGEELRDIVLFDRPADAKPNTESIIFVVEPGDEYAKRVTVRYGRQSGAQMEIISGLAPGDRVIVTDMSPWAGYSRVRLK